MNNVVMSRVDARLVHGQVAVRWSKVTHAEQIIVVDDKTAKDDFLTEVLLLAAPPGIQTIVMFVDDAVAKFTSEEGFGPKNTFFVFPSVETAKRAWDGGLKFEFVNIGQQPKAPGRVRVNNTVQLSQQDIDDLKELDAAGVEVFFHPTPEDMRVDLPIVIKRFEEAK